MSKKRRITTDQARLLAIRYIQIAIQNEVLENEKSSPTDEAWAADTFQGILPERWGDGQTSDQSWQHVKLEVQLQLNAIMKGLVGEAKRVQAENPDFRYQPTLPVG